MQSCVPVPAYVGCVPHAARRRCLDFAVCRDVTCRADTAAVCRGVGGWGGGQGQIMVTKTPAEARLAPAREASPNPRPVK